MTESKNNTTDEKTGKDSTKPVSFWKRHPVLTAFIQGLVFFAVFFTAGELLMRYQVAKSSSTPRSEGGVEFKPDPEIFWKLRPNLNMVMNMPKGGEFTVTTNSQGIRNPEIPFAKPSNGYRIECYGDSITYGHGVNSEYTYEMQLQKLLDSKYAASKKIDVMNFGCPGYTCHQGWHLFNRLGVKYSPDLCILAFNYADPSAEEMSDEERVPKNPAFLTVEKLLYGSELYLAMRQQKIQVDKYGKQKDYYLTSVRIPIERYKQIMRSWAETMKARNGHVIYLSLAMTTPDPFPYYADYRKACEETAKETGNYFIDMNTAFKASGQDMKSLFLLSVAENEDVDRIHPNEKGFAIMAKTINDLIEKENLIK